MKRGREGADSKEVRIAFRTVAFALLLAAAACSGGDDGITLDQLRAEPILSVDLSGADTGRVADEQGGADPMVMVLFDVAADWRDVAVDLADRVGAAGWTVETVNCVATGYDVIARKEIAGEWVLLESGAGTRGAGIILRRDPAQRAPRAFSVTGSCPADLALVASS